MQRGSHADHLNILRRQAVAAGPHGQVLQQQRGHAAHVEHVGRALLVVIAHHAAEDADHHPVVLFLLLGLAGDDGDQPALLGVELDGVHHPVMHHLRIKGAADVIGHAQLVG